MLIPGKTAEEIHLSGGFIYAGDTSQADSCLMLMVSFWRCSSLLLHGAIKCLRMLNGAFFFFLLKKILLTFFQLPAVRHWCQLRWALSFLFRCQWGERSPPVRSGFPALPSGSFWNDWNRSLVLVPWPKLAWVTLGLSWDQNFSRREHRLNAIYYNPFPGLPEPLLICPMPHITDPILLTALLCKKNLGQGNSPAVSHWMNLPGHECALC